MRGAWSSLNIQQTGPASRFSLLTKQRVVEPQTLFTSAFLFDKLPLLWDETVAVSGTATHDSASASILLAVTNASGSQVIRQSREYMYYEPGKAMQLFFTGTFGAVKANCVQRIGYFDANNGLFLEHNGTTLKVVVRSNMSGSVVDNPTFQANWNLDRLDGTGPSGLTVDLTKSQLLVLEFLWLGVGPCRWGFYLNGQIIYVHQREHSNSDIGPYMATPSLPMRYEIINTGATSGATTMQQLCCSVLSETANAPIGIRHSANTGNTGKTFTGNNALLTIRLKSAFKRATLIPRNVSFMSTSPDNLLYQVILNGTIGGTPSYSSVGTDSAVEYDVAGTTVTGGTLISSGYVSTTSRAIDIELSSRIRLAANIAGASDTLSLVVGPMSGGSVTAAGSIDWQEYF